MDSEISIISWKQARPAGPALAGASKSKRREADFLVGPENRLAGAAVAWMLQSGETHYSPLVFHGPTGTGKSLLARGLAQSYSDVLHLHGADFARALAKAYRTDEVTPWRERYRATGMFVLDDVTQLENKPAAQWELIDALDEFEARETPVVITSRVPPENALKLFPALRGRLCGGLVAALAPPAAATRLAFIKRLAAQRGIKISPEVSRLLAAKIAGTMADLRGAMLHLEQEKRIGRQRKRKADQTPIEITLDHVRRFLAEKNFQRAPELEQIIAIVARHYGIKPAEIVGPLRRRQIAMARSMAVYLARLLTGRSLDTLGLAFGDRDHTTMLYSCRSFEKSLARDPQLRRTIERLQDELRKEAAAEPVQNER